MVNVKLSGLKPNTPYTIQYQYGAKAPSYSDNLSTRFRNLRIMGDAKPTPPRYVVTQIALAARHMVEVSAHEYNVRKNLTPTEGVAS